VCARLVPGPRFVVSLFLADYLEVLERCFFVRGEMSEMALRISILNHSGLDSVCGAIGRHDCVKYTSKEESKRIKIQGYPKSPRIGVPLLWK
jgi:hypothetical protein